jgi:hypothetical protein
MARLDELLTEFDVVERHERHVPAPLVAPRRAVGPFSGFIRTRWLAAAAQALR